MDLNQQVQTATVLSNAVEIASGILRRIDGNDISSSQDGPRDIEADVAIELNACLSRGVHSKVNIAVQEATDAA